MMTHKTSIRNVLAGILYFLLCSMANAADVNCSTGMSYQEAVDNFLKPLGVLPETEINEKVAKGVKQTKSVLAGIDELRELCRAATRKDGVYAFFYTLQKVSTGMPGVGQYLAQDIKMGKKILDEANNIANNIAFSGLYDNLGITTNFQIRVSKNGCSTYFWSRCDWLSTTEIHEKIKSASILYKSSAGDVGETSSLDLCVGDTCSNKSNGVTVYYISIGEALINAVSGSLQSAYLKIIWNNGQQSIIPIKSGYISGSAGAYTFGLQFNSSKNWFEYKY
ncbi:MAG: hypothetical protein RJB34_2167 [Pseudomonadota bacterium]